MDKKSKRLPQLRPLEDPIDESATETDDALAPAQWESLGTTRVLGDAPEPPTRRSGQISEEETAIVTPTRAPRELSTLGDFELLKKLGEGAMGAVYLARQVSFNRQVALKVLFPNVAKNPKLVKRLEREGQVMGQLDHPNIVQAYEVNEAQGFHYVAMEYVDGESLQKWLNRLGRLSLGDALHITLTVARALSYAHDLGLVHRDIKPDNILLTRQGIVKVADLGMVKTIDEDMALTQTGHAVGTPWYMPLEQARNAKETDGRCDIYALGCMLYCMLTGSPPFQGHTIVEVIQAKEVGTFPLARSVNPDVPERLDLIILKMTAKHSKYRHAHCNELIRDLEALHCASEQLEFVRQGKPRKGTAVKVAPAAPPPEPEIDADVWYVRAGPDAKPIKVNTVQLRKLLEDGGVRPTAQASHLPDDGFRALATYREFEGSALTRASKKAADTQGGGRVRSLVQSIEAKDRQREQADKGKQEQEQRESIFAKYWQTFWLPGLCVAGGVVLLCLLWYFATGLTR